VIGIDPGSRSTGYGVVEERRGRLLYVAHGVIRANASLPLEQRLEQIFSALRIAFERFRPASVAVEGIFTCRNARSALVLGQARGVVLLLAAQSGLAVREYPPARVKRSVGAKGASDKEAVARMVNGFLRLPQSPPADATDALAVAICHLNHTRLSTAAGFRPARLIRASTEADADKPEAGATTFASRLQPSYRRFGAPPQ
jgi:crossover junction endodeoxyribonuclease RuvC